MATEENTPARRALRMASMGAGVAGSYLGYVLQRAFVSKAEGERKLKRTHTRVARRMRDEMQSLRGPAMKLGQTLSLQAGILPDETLKELASLQMEAPGMHPSLVSVQVKRSLGREPEEIFEKFTPEPFAAASLGQVHEASIRGHKRVAVKIQYPGIRQTVAGDFKAFDPGAASHWLFIRAWDGSGFYVETDDAQIVRQLKAHFEAAEKVEGAEPPYMGLFIHIQNYDLEDL